MTEFECWIETIEVCPRCVGTGYDMSLPRRWLHYYGRGTVSLFWCNQCSVCDGKALLNRMDAVTEFIEPLKRGEQMT